MRAESLGFPLTFDVDGAVVLLVGAADDADTARKKALLEDSGARVRQVAPETFVDGDVDGARLVLVTTREPALAARVATAARARQVIVWCSDDPAQSDVAMPAIAQLGPLRIAISTGGGSPSLAGRLRGLFEAQLGARFGRFVAALAERRKRHDDAAARKADLDDLELTLTTRYPAWFGDDDDAT
ncbi:MAG TPA: NAD(P)-dependent oxidoreductase [Polyangia bacterium]|jgi:precorrin-2 dehydrogenase/sirohydrochlorin ferrochelatase|nr:NAD(P)-dependent oxidoreductase [Polyangia bacterium]